MANDNCKEQLLQNSRWDDVFFPQNIEFELDFKTENFIKHVRSCESSYKIKV